VLPIPFRFVIEAARTIVGHLIAPEQVTSPGPITLARRRQSTHQRSIKQSGVFEPVGLGHGEEIAMGEADDQGQCRMRLQS
jgi:hypothetical protein